MTTILKIKKNFYSLIGITSLIIFSQTTWAAQPAAKCTVSAIGLITQVTNGAGGFDCFAQPAVQKVKFYKAMLCTSAYNTAVSGVTGPNDFLADCTTIYESATGDEINITEGITMPLTGTVTAKAGTYSTLYMELDPTFKYKTAGVFNNPMTYQAITVGRTRFCATNGVAVLTMQAGVLNNVTCNFADAPSARAGALESSVTINELATGFKITQNVAGMSTNRFSAALIDPTTHNVVPWVLNTADAAGTRLAAWTTNLITITPAQALNPNFIVTFSNSKGISTESDTIDQIWGVHPGAFDISVTLE